MEDGIILCSRIQFRSKVKFKTGKFDTGRDLKKDTDQSLIIFEYKTTRKYIILLISVKLHV